MNATLVLRDRIPDAARDIKLNLGTILTQPGALTPAQRWGVAAAAAIASRNPELRDAVVADARASAGDAVVEDARAAAALMAMNNIYYRFRHMIGKAGYSEKPARLRMNRLAQPATTKADLELYALAVSAINGCEMCVRAHEDAILAGGLGEDHVHEAVRIAAVIHGAAVALEMDERRADAAAA
jgi:alkyl hydroperoxide reductase subunit D